MSKELINRRIINVARAVVVAIALSSAFSIQYIWDELDSVKIKMDSQQRRIDAQYQVILKQAQLIDTLIYSIQKLNGLYTEVKNGQRTRTPKGT
jgi:uncharacterized membrane-anchored protein YhcB (DUF1043 family)